MEKEYIEPDEGLIPTKDDCPMTYA